jgi:HNH endonuclease
LKRSISLQVEPLWYLRGLGYSAYLQTNAWRIRKAAYVEGRPMRCERCGLETIDEIEVTYTRSIDPVTGQECSPRKKDAVAQQRVAWEYRAPQFHVHHLSYERLGHESDDDLELLCSPCHNLEHRPDSNAGRWWKQHIQGADDEGYVYDGAEIDVAALDEGTLVEV